MRGTLIYLHGFRSAAASEKARATRAYVNCNLPTINLHIPTLPDQPEMAFATIRALVNQADPSTPLGFIGSSLGGFYATVALEVLAPHARAVLVNPAIFPERDLAPYVGRVNNMVTGETFTWSETHLAQLRVLQQPNLRDPSRYLLCVETGDATLNYREACEKYSHAPQMIIPGGDHRFRSYERLLPHLLEFLLP